MNTAAGGTDERQARTALRWLWVSVLIVIADQASKWLIATRMDLFERIEILPVFDLTHLRNTGAAFSLLADAGGWQRWFFIALAVGISLGIVLWLRRLPARGQTLLASSLALILGGAIGNVIDRSVQGYVTDFLHMHWGSHYFPAFNVADSAISVGALMLVIDSFLEWKRERAAGA